jgi:hypothetical protein
VASAFAAFVNDDDAGPITDGYLSFIDTTNDNGYAMYLATECTDAHWPRNWSFWRRDNTQVARQAPFFTWANAWFNAPCAFWPAKAGHPVNVRGNHAPPILLLDETLDAATPFSGSIEVRQRFRKSVLVATEGGTTHASSPGFNECVDERIAAYLLNGELPARLRSGPDVVCQANPEPEPASAAIARSQRATVATLDRLRPSLIR